MPNIPQPRGHRNPDGQFHAGQFTNRTQGAPARGLGSTMPATMDEAMLMGVAARWPQFTATEIERLSAGLNDPAEIDKGPYAVAEYANNQGAPVDLVWDIRAHTPQSITVPANHYTQGVDPELQKVLEASGARFANSYLDTDGRLRLNSYGVNRIQVDMRAGRLAFRGEGDGAWSEGLDGESNAEVWRKFIARKTDEGTGQFMGKSFDGGYVDFSFNDKTGTGNMQWGDGEDYYDLCMHADGTVEETASSPGGFAAILKTQPAGMSENDAASRIKGALHLAYHQSLTNPALDGSRYQWRTGNITSGREFNLVEERLKSKLSEEVGKDAFLICRHDDNFNGLAALNTQGVDYYARAIINAQGETRFIVNNQEVDALDPKKANQRKMLKFMEANKETLVDLAAATGKGLG